MRETSPICVIRTRRSRIRVAECINETRNLSETRGALLRLVSLYLTRKRGQNQTKFHRRGELHSFI